MSQFSSAVAAIAKGVKLRTDELNQLDAIAGDGDLGVTVGIATSAILEGLSELDGLPTPEALLALGRLIARKAPSTSGTLVAAGLLRAGRAAAQFETVDANAAAHLIETAATAIAERGGAAPGAKTMLDALVPAAKAARIAAEAGTVTADVFAEAARAADEGVEATKAMRPLFGRAGWLSDRSLGSADAGARLVAIILNLIAHQSANAPSGNAV